jgi:trimeric autotransporter adhesin
VSGGEWNDAMGEWTSISGGASNVASGARAWIGGGESNKAKGVASSIFGGKDELEEDPFSWGPVYKPEEYPSD